MENTKEKKGLNVNVKSFITAIAIIFGVMVLCYILTFFIQTGTYCREELEDGTKVIVDGTYQTIQYSDFTFIDWILSPFVNLTKEITVALVIVFLLIIGGIFNSLNSCGLMKYMIDKITVKFGDRKYLLLAVVSFFFMAMGSLIGSFEEVVPLVPLLVALSLSLGWDTLTGLGMSILSVGCGFAAGVCNPFTIGVAQTYAELAMFSGIWLRIVSFFLIYTLLFTFLFLHAKKVDNGFKDISKMISSFQNNPKYNAGFISFAVILGVGILLVFGFALIESLRDYTIAVIAIMFLVAGVVACFISGMEKKFFFKTFLDGLVGILPAALLVMMASSVRYILEEAMILDTILYAVIGVTKGLPKGIVILFIYLFVLIMNFFIASGSAKAAMLIPLIVPVCKLCGINAQLCILAFAFGDGFSNVFYPTNPALLISLGTVDMGYGTWAKFSWKFQVLNLLLTSLILLLGLAVGYC